MLLVGFEICALVRLELYVLDTPSREGAHSAMQCLSCHNVTKHRLADTLGLCPALPSVDSRSAEEVCMRACMDVHALASTLGSNLANNT
eukprot:3470940-Amphidinium_carterae.2